MSQTDQPTLFCHWVHLLILRGEASDHDQPRTPGMTQFSLFFFMWWTLFCAKKHIYINIYIDRYRIFHLRWHCLMEVALKESLEKLISQWLGLPIFTGTTFLGRHMVSCKYSAYIYIWIHIYIYSYIMEISIER